MHEVLRGLVERLGPGVFDDPDNFRGALDDVLDESTSLGDQNLVVDAVRLGAYSSMVTMLGQGGDPASTVAQAGARLARDRGGDDRVSASWACACLAYAVGAVGEAEVRHYRTARYTREVAPPTEIPAPSPAPVTQARPEVLPSTPAPPPPPPPEPPPGRGWVVPVLLVLALVLAGVAGVLGADLLQDDDSPETADTSGTPTSDTPTSIPPTTTTPPTTSPPTTTVPPPPAPTPVAVRVENTCGKSGAGDCFLSERAEPLTTARLLTTYDEGATLRVTCQITGQAAYSSVLDTSSRIWAQTTDGGYVAAIFLDGIDKFDVTTPCR
jgi:hypothetical protein